MPDVLGIDTPEAFEIGSYDGMPIRSTDERHILLFGGNRSGKGTRVLAPNLLRMSGQKSLVVMEPKAELPAISAKWRRTVSDVVILNPFGVLTEYEGYDDLKGVGFNPLASLDPASENFAINTSLLVEAMIALDDRQSPHWNNSARALVSAIMMYVVLIARKHGKMPTMARVRELLCMASDAPHRGNDFQGAGIPKLARVMMKSSIPSLKNKAAQFTDWNNEIAGIASTAKIQTECFDDPQIAASMSRDDFDFRDLKRKPTTVYIVIPPEMMNRHGKWLRMVLTCALQATMRPRRQQEPRILFMLDEAGSALGHMQILEDTWALTAGYGIQFLLAFQDLNQLKSIYKDRWETFIANAGVTMSFRANDLTTAGWLSKRMGETTRLMETENESESESRGVITGTGISRNRSPIKVPYMPPQEMFGLRTGEMVAFMAGDEDVWHIQADAYYEIESRDRRARLNPYFHDVPLRKALPNSASSSTRYNSASLPSAPVYEATLKWFSAAKGYGVVALADGIAILHANVLHQAGYTEIKAWATLRVHLTQSQGGRVVSKILSVDESKTNG